MKVLLKKFALVFGMLGSTFVHAATEPLPVIDARFETVQCAIPCKKSVKSEWWMMRAADQVEIRDFNQKSGKLSSRGEIWKRNPDGKLSYLFLMHEDQRVIEYLFDDLKVLNISADENKWQATSQLITEGELVRLKRSLHKTLVYHGYLTEAYSGEFNSTKIKLLWLPQLHIPVKLEYIYPKSRVTVQLRQLNVGKDKIDTSAEAPKTTEQMLASYQQVYYTDIGDMEQNDDAKEWLAKAQGAPGLHSHQH